MRALDFALRLAFFAAVPFLATYVSVFFPMTIVLLNVAVTLVVFAAAEAVRDRAGRSPLFERLVRRRLAFEAYYREHPPRPFLFYVLYPLLLPYVLARPETRRELWLYRGFTGAGLVLLLLAAAADFLLHWPPELRLVDFLLIWLLLYGIQTLCIFVFLLPVSTTVVKLHAERRLRELWMLLGVAAISVAAAVIRLEHRRGHIVSWVTTHRVKMRTQASPSAAHAAQIKALRAVWGNLEELREATDKDGWVEGDALDRAEEHLGAFYKSDEAYAFSLHALPAAAPEVLVLQCHLERGAAPIWRAVRRSGQEVLSAAELPSGVLGLKRRTTRRPPTRRTPDVLRMK
jgi:hypothetical protein